MKADSGMTGVRNKGYWDLYAEAFAQPFSDQRLVLELRYQPGHYGCLCRGVCTVDDQECARSAFSDIDGSGHSVAGQQARVSQRATVRCDRVGPV